MGKHVTQGSSWGVTVPSEEQGKGKSLEREGPPKLRQQDHLWGELEAKETKSAWELSGVPPEPQASDPVLLLQQDFGNTCQPLSFSSVIPKIVPSMMSQGLCFKMQVKDGYPSMYVQGNIIQP